MGEASRKKGSATIAETIKRNLKGVFTLILGVVIMIALSLFMFTRYTAVVTAQELFEEVVRE